jgi:hypothetical protein
MGLWKSFTMSFSAERGKRAGGASGRGRFSSPRTEGATRILTKSPQGFITKF